MHLTAKSSLADQFKQVFLPSGEGGVGGDQQSLTSGQMIAFSSGELSFSRDSCSL